MLSNVMVCAVPLDQSLLMALYAVALYDLYFRLIFTKNSDLTKHNVSALLDSKHTHIVVRLLKLNVAEIYISVSYSFYRRGG